jgi:hypothetical protein
LTTSSRPRASSTVVGKRKLGSVIRPTTVPRGAPGPEAAEPDLGDRAERVLHHVERGAAQEQPIARGERRPAEVHRRDRARARVDAEELPRVRLHDEQVAAVGRDLDPVEVEAGWYVIAVPVRSSQRSSRKPPAPSSTTR